MSCDALTQAVFGMLEESGTWREFAVELGHELGWTMDDAQCIRRVRQYRNRQEYRHLPAVAIPVAIRVSRLDYVTPILQRELIRAEDEEPRKPSVRSVRRDRLREVC